MGSSDAPLAEDAEIAACHEEVGQCRKRARAAEAALTAKHAALFTQASQFPEVFHALELAQGVPPLVANPRPRLF